MYAVDAPISYTCCFGFVAVNISSFIFSNDGAAITASPSHPVTLSGSPTMCPTGSFTNAASIPGGCTETYTLQGAFTDADTWTGTYSINFVGPQCACVGSGAPCVDQTFSVTGRR